MLGKSEIAAFVGTKDAIRSREFYENKLGLTFVSDEPYAIVFDANGITLRIQKVHEVAPIPYTALGWHVTGIEAVMAKLVERGVAFETRRTILASPRFQMVPRSRGSRTRTVICSRLTSIKRNSFLNLSCQMAS